MVICTDKFSAKVIMYACNALFVAFGIADIVFGALILTGNTSFQNDQEDVIVCGSLLIIGGIFLFPAMILGILGTLKEAAVLLEIFLAPITISLLSAVALTIFLNRAYRTDNAKEMLATALNNYNSSKVDRRFWKDLQKDYKCCGIDDYGDWASKGISLPESCCEKYPSPEAQDENESCKSFRNDLSYVHRSGCYNEVHCAQKLLYIIILVLQVIFLLCGILTLLSVLWLVYEILQKFPWSRSE